MISLSEHFTVAKSNDGLEINVPNIAFAAMRAFTEITGAKKLCIGGGFLRGLYMQQHLRVTPTNNDIDIFADLNFEDFQLAKQLFIENFAQKPETNPEEETIARLQTGEFGESGEKRGLVEVLIPEDIRKISENVRTIQFNFGPEHAWADAALFAQDANLGINQIAIDLSAKIHLDPLFLSDMRTKHITMNQHRLWTLNDHKRTIDKIDRMIAERPEFSGWTTTTIPEPSHHPEGSFWDRYRRTPKYTRNHN